MRELAAAFRIDLSGRKVALDCANGATYRVAPRIFEQFGATVEAIGVEPDGRNINAGVGSTHVEALAARVAASDAEIGFAFDGDGDRVLAVDGAGRVHDGDELIALAARGLASRGELGGGVVVTVMTNFGFHQAMAEAGIDVAVTPVGDRYVIDEMLRREWRLGGEQSGHIIASDIVATGDGIAAALLTMRELAGSSLADARADGEAAAAARQRRGRRPREPRAARAPSGTRSQGERRARRPRAGPPAPFGHRAAGAGDGRGAGGGRGRRGLRPAGGAGPRRARLRT